MYYFKADSASPICSFRFPQSLGRLFLLSRVLEGVGFLRASDSEQERPSPSTPQCVLVTTLDVQGALAYSTIPQENIFWP